MGGGTQNEKSRGYIDLSHRAPRSELDPITSRAGNDRNATTETVLDFMRGLMTGPRGTMCAHDAHRERIKCCTVSAYLQGV
jgi:hypothetical protein